MAAIDVGSEATDRASNIAFGDFTIILRDNVANLTGKITSLEAWAYSTLSGANKVGLFQNTTGTTFVCRSAAALASIASGSKQTITQDSGAANLSLSVLKGDYIGFYAPTGAMEAQTTGSEGYYYAAGDHCTVSDSAEYTLDVDGDGTASFKGLGTTWANIAKVCGVDIGEVNKIDGTYTYSISKVNGVAV